MASSLRKPSNTIGKRIPFNTLTAQAIWEMLGVGGARGSFIYVNLDGYEQTPGPIIDYRDDLKKKLLTPHQDEIIAYATESFAKTGIRFGFLDFYALARKFNIPSHGKDENSYKGCEYWIRDYWNLKEDEQQLILSIEQLTSILTEKVPGAPNTHISSDSEYFKSIIEEFNSFPDNVQFADPFEDKKFYE